MAWAYEDCDWPLKVMERQADYGLHLKERFLEEEGKRKKVEGQLETQGVELDAVRAELATARAEVAHLTAEGSKYWEDALMEVSRLQVRAKTTERKATKATEDVARLRLWHCQSISA